MDENSCLTGITKLFDNKYKWKYILTLFGFKIIIHLSVPTPISLCSLLFRHLTLQFYLSEYELILFGNANLKHTKMREYVF